MWPALEAALHVFFNPRGLRAWKLVEAPPLGGGEAYSRNFNAAATRYPKECQERMHHVGQCVAVTNETPWFHAAEDQGCQPDGGTSEEVSGGEQVVRWEPISVYLMHGDGITVPTHNLVPWRDLPATLEKHLGYLGSFALSKDNANVDVMPPTLMLPRGPRTASRGSTTQSSHGVA